jgi:hypothetical protein
VHPVASISPQGCHFSFLKQFARNKMIRWPFSDFEEYRIFLGPFCQNLYKHATFNKISKFISNFILKLGLYLAFLQLKYLAFLKLFMA